MKVVDLLQSRQMKWYWRNAEHARAYRRKRYADNTDAERAYRVQYAIDNPDAARMYREQYKIDNPSGLAWKNYRAGARVRKINFELTKEQFMEFWQKPCFYCGALIDKIGLDRIDNSVGYVLENVRPCCTVCNFGKGTKTPEVYINHCHAVSHHQRQLAEGGMNKCA